MFKDRLKEVRLSHGYTIERLSELSGVSVNSYKAWESGRVEPKLSSLLKLAKALDISLDFLVNP